MIALKNIFLTAFFFGLLLPAVAQISWPPIKQDTKPWARWWWQGSAVNKKDLTANLEDYAAAGLGGLEITPIYGVQGAEQSFVPFLSQQWMELLKYTLQEAKRLDLGIDMANGTGWPFGGPWVKDKDASKSVYFKSWQLKEGETLTEPIVYHQEAFVRTANNRPLLADTLSRDIAVNKNLQLLALDQVKFSGPLPLQLLIAYSDKGQSVDLTTKVSADGKLDWKAPAGNWQLYALFTGLHGKMVERAAPGGEGYAIDHFSAEALNTFLSRFDEAFKGHDLGYIRALFNDSYEVDDARGQSNWTPKMLEAFRKRRGYNLEQHLPALFQKDRAEKNRRVLHDYRTTVDELILEHFTRKWKDWGAQKGKLIRNQSHGSPANLLDLYGAVDIPETEGNDILRFKFATSAANLLGKKLVSAEAATWLNEHFLSSWADVKKAVDLYLLAGVNHIFYHGVNYSPKDAPWPGWLFYAAVHFNQANPQWKDFKQLNEYVARCQSFLQSGLPDNDILLYFPLSDRYMEPGTAMLQHFDGMEHNFEGTNFEHASKWMQEQGFTFDFISDRQLLATNFNNGLHTGGANRYAAVMLPGNKYITESTFQRLYQLADKGAKILVFKSLPQEVPGFYNYKDRNIALQKMLQRLTFKTDANGLQHAVVGKGAFLLGDDLNSLLSAAAVRKEPMVDSGIQFLRRKQQDGYSYFLNNRTDKPFSSWLPLGVAANRFPSAAIFDPMSGANGIAKTEIGADGNLQVFVQLQPFESCVVQVFSDRRTGDPFLYKIPTGSAQDLKGAWQVQFESGGPTLPKPIQINNLSSWTTWDNLDLEHFSGTARYRLSFAKPIGNADRWLLNLGYVDETAEVCLNGFKLATLIGPTYTVTVPAKSFKETNSLEIIVANLMANRIRYMDRNGIEWKKFYNINMSAKLRTNLKNGLFDAGSWEPQSSGLIGPVTLTPVTHAIE